MTRYIIVRGRPGQIRRELREWLPADIVRICRRTLFLSAELPDGTYVELTLMRGIAVLRVEEA